MKKLTVTKGILWGVTALGSFLVSQGIFTGEELSAMQNVIGMALSGAGLTSIGILSIMQAVPDTVIEKGFEKAVDVYGKEKVLHVLDKFDDIVSAQVETLTLLKDVKAQLNAQDEIRNNLLE